MKLAKRFPDDIGWLTRMGFAQFDFDTPEGIHVTDWRWDKATAGVYMRVTYSPQKHGWKAVTGSGVNPRVAEHAWDAVLMCVDAIARKDKSQQALLDEVMDAQPSRGLNGYRDGCGETCGTCRYFLGAPVNWCALASSAVDGHGVCDDHAPTQEEEVEYAE